MADMEYVKQFRILVVDDDETSRKLMRVMLGPMGVAVGEAENGQVALDMIGAGGWDAVLLDIGMPVMDGFQALERIRSSHSMEDLPVLLVTGQDDAQARQKGLKLKANDFIAKPVDQAEFMARLGGILSICWLRATLGEEVKELKRTQELKDLVLRIFLHDLRSPLTSGKGFAELALEETEDKGGAAADHLKKALESLDRVAGMAAGAADIIGPGEGRLVPRLREVEMEGTVRSRLESFGPIFRKRRISATCSAGQGLPRAKADAGMLDRVLDNLINNAVRNTPEGGRIAVTVGLDAERQDLVVSVENTGGRLPFPCVRRKLGRYEQEDLMEKGYDAGTGLGMTYCRMAMESNGGGVWIDGGPDADTRISIWLPPAGGTGSAGTRPV